MERSLSFTTLFFYRTTILLLLLLLFPVLVQADESVYEHQIQQARNGNYALFLDYLQRYEQQHASEARQLVKDAPSPAHLETLSYVWMRQGKNGDRLLADMRALNAAPGNNALLRETIDALTENRVSTPALWLSQSVAMSPAERRRLERNAAAERVRLADVPGRTEKTSSLPVSIGLAPCMRRVITGRSLANMRR